MLSAQAIQKHYEAYAGKLLNWLVAMGTSREVACEILQETFLRLWERRGEFSETQEVSAFLFAVARNIRIDIYRKDKPLVFGEEDYLENLDGREGNVAPHDIAYLRKRLQGALAKLPKEQAEAYALFQVAGWSVKQIAALTDASESLVKVRIHRAKEKLAEALVDLKEDWA